MLRALLRRAGASLLDGTRQDEPPEDRPEAAATSDEDDDGGFAFSLLDASVQYAHGQQGAGATKEIHRTSERADELERADDRHR